MLRHARQVGLLLRFALLGGFILAVLVPANAAAVAPCTNINPVHAPTSYHTECTPQTFPLAEVVSYAGRGHEYRYNVDGSAVDTTTPPSTFDAATASESERRAYGIPAQPALADTSAHALWEQMVNNLHFQAPPATLRLGQSRPETTQFGEPQLTRNTFDENWAGYADTGTKGKYINTGIIFEQPYVSDRCSGGEASFWTGLGGDGTTPLDQAGTEVDGEQHLGWPNQAWFEIYPQELPVAVPLEGTPGRDFEVTVEHTSGKKVKAYFYDFATGQATTWTGESRSEEYSGASAEYITERTPGISMTNFGQFNVAEAWVNGNHTLTPGNFTHEALDITEGSKRLTTTSALSPQETGREFYTKWDNSGSTCTETAFPTAFQANTKYAYERFPNGEYGPLGEAMAPHTSPAIEPNGDVAFQGSNNDLWLYNGSYSEDLGAGMAPGTSPAIQPDGQIAFQSNNNYLYIRRPKGELVNSNLGMASGTSPSIAPDGEIVAQANSGILWRRNTSGEGVNTGAGMASGTSPVITPYGEIAFQANTGILYRYVPPSGLESTGDGMASGTSPAIQVNGQIVFQSNNGYLYFRQPGGKLVNSGLGMAAATSPAVAPDGEVVFQANNGYLYRRTTSGTAENTGLGMEAETSPSIAE
jgi:Peptidase A4 family